MSFLPLTSMDQLDLIKKDSKPSIIFKHSTRCSISSMAKNRVEKGMEALSQKYNVYYLDLIQYRQISNQIADVFEVEHASPQILVIKDGASIYDASHGQISASELDNFSN